MPYGVNAFEIRDNQEGETGTANQAIRSEQCYIRMENRWMEFSIGTGDDVRLTKGARVDITIAAKEPRKTPTPEQ
jgi:hypothetical protein